MKTIQTIKALLGILPMLLLTPLTGFGGEGTAGGGGGNNATMMAYYLNSVESQSDSLLDLERGVVSATLREATEGGWLKRIFLRTIQNSQFQSYIKDPKARATFLRMIQDGLQRDIVKSQYILTDGCFDEKNQRVALSTRNGSAKNPLIGENICFDPDRFSESYIREHIPGVEYHIFPVWQVFGLFMHDHARHFGVTDDANHSFAYNLSRAFFDFNQLIPFEDYENRPKEKNLNRLPLFLFTLMSDDNSEFDPKPFRITIDTIKVDCYQFARSSEKYLRKNGIYPLFSQSKLFSDLYSNTFELECASESVSWDNTRVVIYNETTSNKIVDFTVLGYKERSNILLNIFRTVNFVGIVKSLSNKTFYQNERMD